MANTSPYDVIVDMIKKLDLRDDGIVMNHKIKSIEQDFCNIVLDEHMLSESMDYINGKVLSDSDDAALKFALLFSSRNFDSLAMKETKVRCKMLNILQNNFCSAEQYRKENKNILYNSITLLGEYYHRARLADGSPIDILGESLLGLLTNELTRDLNCDGESQIIDTKLAKLILSQITLNGSIMRSKHKEELDVILYHIRRSLIEMPNLLASSKALLLMSLDLYYSNFSSLGENLENMYTKYLTIDDDENNINDKDSSTTILNKSNENGHNLLNDENKDVNNCDDNIEVCDIMKTKWSEEVSNNVSVNSQQNDNEYCDNTNEELINNEDIKTSSYNSLDRRQSHDEMPISYKNHDQYIYNNRFTINTGYEDDRNSVRSEGGSIKLYNVNDRLKHGQRNNNNNNNQNPNWSRNYNSFDRNRRSSSRNSNHQYDNRNTDNNYSNKNRRNYNTYHPPPRFSNNEHWRNNNNNNTNNNNNENYNNRQNFKVQESNSRSSSRTRNFPHHPQRKNSFENHQNGSGSGGRSLSPELINKQSSYTNLNKPFNRNNNFNIQSSSQQQLPNNNQQHQYRQQSRNFSHNRNNRYGSHNSLTSDTGTWERRGRQRNNSRGKSQDYFHHDDTRSVCDQSVENWENLDDNQEIVKNARNTTEYMRYLSKK